MSGKKSDGQNSQTISTREVETGPNIFANLGTRSITKSEDDDYGDNGLGNLGSRLVLEDLDEE